MRREVVAVILGTMLSWHVPRYLIQNEAQIALKRPPYQVLQTLNEVVLDPALNLPWIDPPTIPCKSLECGTRFFTGVSRARLTAFRISAFCYLVAMTDDIRPISMPFSPATLRFFHCV
jgi:hypothetical protein